MTIPFTEYKLPDGRKIHRDVDIVSDRPEIEELAHKFIAAGGYFEMEVLSGGTTSVAAGHPKCETGDCAIELLFYRTASPEAAKVYADRVESLVRNAILWANQNLPGNAIL